MGFLATSGWVDLASRADEPDPADFIAAYMKEFGEFPNTGAMLGYFGATGFTRALEAAGRDLTVESFLNVMGSLDYYDPVSDNHVNHSANDQQGSDRIIMSMVEGGSWKVVARLE